MHTDELPVMSILVLALMGLASLMLSVGLSLRGEVKQSSRK